MCPRSGDIGIPPPSRFSGIIKLGGNCKVIYGAQSLTGKIFETKELRQGIQPGTKLFPDLTLVTPFLRGEEFLIVFPLGFQRALSLRANLLV